MVPSFCQSLGSASVRRWPELDNVFNLVHENIMCLVTFQVHDGEIRCVLGRVQLVKVGLQDFLYRFLPHPGEYGGFPTSLYSPPLSKALGRARELFCIPSS